MVVKNTAGLVRPSVREKKKLAPRVFCSSANAAIVLATVDLPIPAIPFNQKIGEPSPGFSASHFLMSLISFSLVPAKHRTVALIEDALYEAVAVGSDLSNAYSSISFVIGCQKATFTY